LDSVNISAKADYYSDIVKYHTLEFTSPTGVLPTAIRAQ